MPRPLRGIFRKRRHLLDLLFSTSIECLRDWFRACLDLPGGQLAAIAAVQTFPNRILVLDGDPIPPDEFFGS